ncbi:MAG: helix-turn-helix domain-containing protein [Ruminococcaceae bacterium]|nr:helix-turn-helix domain-containing protein [Oscillospiraceae bacterium]
MLYQKIMTGNRSYRVSMGRMTVFEEHRHADMELRYCLEDEGIFRIDKTDYLLKPGHLAVVAPMVSHSIPQSSSDTHRSLMVITGASFLKEHFRSFSLNTLSDPIIDLNKNDGNLRNLKSALDDIALLCTSTGSNKELLTAGNVFRVCGFLLAELEKDIGGKDPVRGDLRAVANVEKALELIHCNYSDRITLEHAARVAGYTQSSFCKIFKTVTGDTFHKHLNRHRIQASLGYLTETNTPIADIAVQVGFGEVKTFCRVFSYFMGTTPGAYRKEAMRQSP